MASNLTLSNIAPGQAYYSVMSLDGARITTQGDLTINGTDNPALWPITAGVLSSTAVPLSNSTFYIGSGTAPSSFAQAFAGSGSGLAATGSSTGAASAALSNFAATGNLGASSLNGILGATPDASISLFNIVGVCLPPDQRDDEAAAAQESCKATTSVLPQVSPFEMAGRDASLVAAASGAPRTR
jgi:hypothetical protein